MTITSGRAWAATATASRTELASAHTTTSVVSASRSLMPSRTTWWSSTSMTRSGGALMSGILAGPARFALEPVIAAPTRSRKSFTVASATRWSSTRSTVRPTTPRGGR